MKKLFKKLALTALSIMLCVSAFTIAASADHMDFGGATGETDISNYATRSWDTGKIANGIVGKKRRRKLRKCF